MKNIMKIGCIVLAALMCTMVLASCGNKQELNFGKKYNPADDQTNVLLQLNASTIDVGVMDSIMAGYYMKQDTTFSNSLMIIDGLTLAVEQYGIGCRKGSGLAKMINTALIELAKAGTVLELATKYGIAADLCIDTSVTVSELTESEKADWEFVKNNGKFVVGYTLFAPIAYKNDANELVGFDIELAKAVAEYLELTVEFKLIKWDSKEIELTAKTIDCIWNGMTINEERLEKMEMSIPYLNNTQVAVIRKADAAKYKTTADMADAIIGAEAGSAGEDVIVKSK